MENKKDSDAEIALLTFQTEPYHTWNSILTYTPLWISGNSTNTNITRDDSYKSFTPAQFLIQCQYPFIRFCNIPFHPFNSVSFYNYFVEWYEYEYYHQLCIEYEITNPAQIIKYISDQITSFESNCNILIGKKHQTCGHSTSHLFLMKEYINMQNNKWNEVIEAIKISPMNMFVLPIDIIQHTLSEFIYEVKVSKDIYYLNDNTKINQIKWFEYVFYFIEFASKKWQMFCYEYILKNGAYNAVIIDLMTRYKKLAFRQFKCVSLTEFCMELCPYKFSTTTITSFIKYTIEMNVVGLFERCLKLFDENSIKATCFWGGFLFDIAKFVENERLYLFKKVCLKMKEHCDGNKKIIEKSFKKFNTKFCDGLKHTGYDEVTLKCVKIMENLLKYDIHSMIPYCCSNHNETLMQYLIEHNCLDRNVCKENYSDEMNGLFLDDFITN